MVTDGDERSRPRSGPTGLPRRGGLGRSDDEEGVAVGIAQAELRGDARRRGAAPPRHFPYTKWLLVHVVPLGAERGEVREDVSAQEHHARLDPRRPLRPADD